MLMIIAHCKEEKKKKLLLKIHYMIILQNFIMWYVKMLKGVLNFPRYIDSLSICPLCIPNPLWMSPIILYVHLATMYMVAIKQWFLTFLVLWTPLTHLRSS